MQKFIHLLVVLLGSCVLISMVYAKAPAAKSVKPAVVAAKSAAGQMPPNIIDNMNLAPAGWLKEKDKGTSLALAAGQAQTGKALEITYNLGDEGAWLGVRKKITSDVSDYKGIKFSVRGEGAYN